jgi:hypothetical protein
MARYVFYSFHYDEDCMRVQQVRNIGAVAGSKLANANEWEQVWRAGPRAVQSWIDNEMNGKTCCVVLIGAQTWQRPWVLYEIQRAWHLKKGVVGVHIHGLQNPRTQQTSFKGANPITQPNALGSNAYYVPVHDPAGWNSTEVYASIARNLESWIDEAVALRKRYP